VLQSKTFFFFYKSWINYDVINDLDLFCDSATAFLLIIFFKEQL